PQNYLSHYYLGRFFMTEKDYENALKSYQKAIELKNDVPRLYIGLSNAQQALEKNDDAVVSIEKAVKIEPTNSSYHFTQSHLTLRLGKDMLCSLRASYFLKYKGWNDEDSPYAVLNLYFANRRSGTGKEKAVLKQAIANLNKEVWAYSIIKYLNGEIDKNALLNLADDVDKRTEANAYIGFDLLLLGKIEEAKQYLNWVKTNGNRDFTEYDLSISLLNSIEKETTNPQPEK
ncbi:MAG TPA: tetratricopeptide repeat protein, partial [Pyrinomonadaceae bacterium]|nr:tetratricopeptide repeat protein [Pyrinomonadaceae bacterium]